MPWPLSWIDDAEVAVGDACSAPLQAGAAVLDDVADRLAQDRAWSARRRAPAAGAARLLGRRCASRPRLRPGSGATRLGAPVGQRVGSRTGLPVRPRTDSRISSSASRASVEMRSLSLVCTMVSSLAPRSSCRSAAMRLRSCSVTCSTRSSASCAKLRSISVVSFAHAALQFGAAVLARSAARGRTAAPGASRAPGTSAAGMICSSGHATRRSTPSCWAPNSTSAASAIERAERGHRPELRAPRTATACAGTTAPRAPTSTASSTYQKVAMACRCCAPMTISVSGISSALRRQRHVDPAPALAAIAQQELHGRQRDERRQDGQQELRAARWRHGMSDSHCRDSTSAQPISSRRSRRENSRAVEPAHAQRSGSPPAAGCR